MLIFGTNDFSESQVESFNQVAHVKGLINAGLEQSSMQIMDTTVLGIAKCFMYDRILDSNWLLPLIILYFHPTVDSVSDNIKQTLAVFFNEFFQVSRANQLLLEKVQNLIGLF